jgi:prepilin-type processing-associated H-X9-DG protein
MNESGNNPPPADSSASEPLEYARPTAPAGKSARVIVMWAIVGTLAFAFLVSILLPALNSRQPPSNRLVSASNLKQIGLAMIMYANEHHGEFPDSMRTILANEDLTPDVFVNPGGSDNRAAGPTTQAMLADFAKPGRCSYLYFGRGLLDTGDPTTVVACEAPGSQRWTGMNVLFLDGHVEFVDQKAAQQIRVALASGPVAWTSTGGTTRPTSQPTTKPIDSPLSDGNPSNKPEAR